MSLFFKLSTNFIMKGLKSVCRDLMLPQFPLSKIGTYPPTYLAEKGENRNWTDRLEETLVLVMVS